MTYDVIVVGGGSAGCVAAGRLVGEFGARVLLLEAGGSDRSLLVRAPAGLVKLMAPGSRFYTEHVSIPQPQLAGRAVPLLQANVLGGGSSVNAMTYTRGTRRDYDGWDAALGGVGWSWDEMLPVFIRQEANQRLGAPHHGVDGPLKVSDPHHPLSAASRAFLLALQARGVPFVADFNAGETAGAGIIQSTTYRGERWNAARAFLAPVADRPNLTVKLGTRAIRILVEDGRAVGVAYGPAGGGPTTVARAGTVLLTAGCFASAQLLMLSGIGPAAELARHGISCIADLPGLGEGLQDHNDIRIGFETVRNIGYSGEDRGVRMLWNGVQYLLARSGPATSTGSEVTAFVNPLDPTAEPTIQYYCLGRLRGGARAPSGITLVANLVAPLSRGRMSLRSADPLALPLVDPRWLTEIADEAQLIGGAEALLELAGTAPLRDEIRRCVPFDRSPGRAEMAAYVRRETSTNWHPVGSCRMGRDDDADAVVDARLRVRGVENLRVLDGSIMPTIVGANTNAPIMAIAHRGVDFLMGAGSLERPDRIPTHAGQPEDIAS